MNWWIETILILLLPYIIRYGMMFYRYIISRRTKGTTTTPSKEQPQVVEEIFGKTVGNDTSAALPYYVKLKVLMGVIAGAYFLYAAYDNVFYFDTFFKTLNVEPSAPSFVVRNAFMDYVASRRAHDDDYDSAAEQDYYEEDYDGVSFEDPNPIHVYPRLVRMSAGRKASTLSADELYRELSEYEYLFMLYESLKSSDNKLTYLMYGPEAYLKCEWCKESYEFGAYRTAEILPSYALVLLVIGIVTMTITSKRQLADGTIHFETKRFDAVRVSFCLLLCSALATEVGLLFFPADILSEVTVALGYHSHHLEWTWYCDILRNAAVGVALLSVSGSVFASLIASSIKKPRFLSTLFSKKDTTENRLTTINSQLNVLTQYMRKTQLQCLALQHDEELLEGFKEYCEGRIEDRSKILNDPEFMSVLKETFEKPEMQQWKKKAEQHEYFKAVLSGRYSKTPELSDEGFQSYSDNSP